MASLFPKEPVPPFDDARELPPDMRQLIVDLKADDDLHTIPVVVLTTSHAEEDVLKTYTLHANCYVASAVASRGCPGSCVCL